MADLVSYGAARRDIDQALIALKKGTRLLKYGRKGKPKFCPFRLSNDESSLIWISRSGERSLKLASVSRIIPGQRTVVFQRYLRPEKYYSSFSLIYNNGKHSVDVICKDKFEAEVWIAGLKALISPGQGGCSKIDGRSEGGLSFNENRRDLTSDSPSNGFGSVTQDTSSAEGESAIISTDSSPYTYQPENYVFCERSHVMLDRKNMQVKGSSFDAFRASVSSAPSTSSHGSAADDSDGLGDVYIWGEVVCDNFMKVGPDKNANFLNTRTDVLLPRLLESDVVLDVHNVACGPRHAALVTRQGEVFTWGEESGGCLGHGTGKDVTHPRLIESLSSCNVNTVACGEFHTCAVTVGGELHTWGDGTHNTGLLGHGTDVSHWIPKRVAGTLEGLQVALVTCGPWHTALVTTKGQLFTFGDGTFGVLGHGDRENVLYPREVESLAGLRTVAVACGVWHTAAVVEVIPTQSSASISSGKLFTWGDGDKNRLGHGDREVRLKPTCVPPLIDYNFQKVACGHSLTVGLTTSGQIFTLGTTVYGQLGNPHADGKLPCLVEDKLVGESVGEIACGAFHVTVLTARNEVYTWGRGANGRLGHGDIEDRKTPALVEALRDRHVKYISCGSNYTAVICLNKWVSSSEQSQCSACRQAFGFTRKRHNCYNCGLAHCHSCSSRKASRVALAPNPSKPCRVCDSCYAKLSKVSEAGVNNRRVSANRLSGENKDRLDSADLRIPKSVMPSNLDLIKLSDGQAAKQGKKSDGFFHVALSHSTFLAVDVQQSVPKSAFTSSRVSSRSVSPLLTSPTCSVAPVPTIFGLSSESMTDSLKKSNELLNQEVHQLRAQVESLRQQYGLHASELQKSEKKAQEALALAAHESAELKAGNEAIQSLTGRLKDMAKRLPNGAYDTDRTRPSCVPNSLESNGFHLPDAKRECHSRADSDAYSISGSCFHLPDAKRECHSRADSEAYSISGSCFHLPDAKRECHSRADSEAYSISGLCLTPSTTSDNSTLNGNHNPNLSSSNEHVSSGTYPDQQHRGLLAPNGARLLYENGANQSSSNTASETVDGKSGIKSSNTSGMVVNSNQVEAEWTEHYEPGVVITLVAFRGGFRDLRRLRFSRRIFGEQQAEGWWSENREKVYERYNICGPSGRGSQP